MIHKLPYTTINIYISLNHLLQAVNFYNKLHTYIKQHTWDKPCHGIDHPKRHPWDSQDLITLGLHHFSEKQK